MLSPQTHCPINIALVQELLSAEELDQLRTEFPQYQFICPAATADTEVKSPRLSDVSILYSRTLSREQLEQMPRLRWIHCPDPQLTELPLKALNAATQVILTHTRGENLQQIREYVLTGVMAWAKQLFFWSQHLGEDRALWQQSAPKEPWFIKGKTFLQIGLGRAGGSIAEGAQFLGFRVWGCDKQASFHPHCNRVYPWQELHSLLPAADVVSICLPRAKRHEHCFAAAELALMKDDAILTLVGAGNALDEAALAKEAGRFRGVVIDSFAQTPLPKQSPLWKLPNALLTPEVSSQPKQDQRLAFRSFRWNLRQFLHRNVQDMQNLVERPFEEVMI